MFSISELISRARAGDEDALEQVIRAYQQRVAAMVISLIGNDDDWQDVCQQIFVKMILGLRRLDNANLFEPWLFRIVRNGCFDHLRRRRSRWIFVPWRKSHDSIASGASRDADSRSAALDVAIQRLPADQRELVTLVRTQRWTYSRLAEMSGQSVAAIKSTLFRARRRLRQLMADNE